MNKQMSALRVRARERLAQLTPRQRQSASLALLLLTGIGLLWLVFATTASPPRTRETQTATGPVSAVTNIGVLPPGGQVNPVDQWVGTAGRKLAQYESEREEQSRLNKDRQSFETRTQQRIGRLHRNQHVGSWETSRCRRQGRTLLRTSSASPLAQVRPHCENRLASPRDTRNEGPVLGCKPQSSTRRARDDHGP